MKNYQVPTTAVEAYESLLCTISPSITPGYQEGPQLAPKRLSILD